MSWVYKGTLAALAAVAMYTLHGLSKANGTFPAIEHAAEARLLADDTLSWPSWLQDVPPVGALLGFFWPVASAKHLDLLLMLVPFTGLFVSATTVTMIEGLRKGNRGGVATYTTLYGFLYQMIGFAVIDPLFLLLNLFRSPLPSNPTPATLTIPSLAHLKALPFSIVLGFFLPSTLMFLPHPVIHSLDTKVLAILLWQIFPAWIALSQILLAPLFSPSKTSTTTSTPSSPLPALRTAYAFALSISAFTHIAFLTLTLTPLLAPQIFNPLALPQLSFTHVLVPEWHAAPIANIADGALRFLKWDYALGATAHLVWALAATAKTRAQGRVRSAFGSGNTWLDVVVRSVSVGPAGAALCLVWERDEAVLGEGHLKST